jgi:hypothetical protein
MTHEWSNYRPALDAASAFCSRSEGRWRRASDPGRWALRNGCISWLSNPI